MRLFGREPRVLKIQLAERLLKLHPGDTLWLTHDAYTDIDGHRRVDVAVTHKYTWDGKVLRQEKCG